MPCRDYAAEAQDNEEVRRKLDNVTRYLCTVMGQLEFAGVVTDYGSEEINRWWMNRKAEDAARREAERAKTTAEKERLRA